MLHQAALLLHVLLDRSAKQETCEIVMGLAHSIHAASRMRV